MTLLRYLAEFAPNRNPNLSNLLLIDQPELYMHPHAIEQIRQALESLSKQGYQIIFTTHSPLMIDYEEMLGVTLLVRNEQRGS